MARSLCSATVLALLLLTTFLGTISCEKKKCVLMEKAINCAWDAFQNITKDTVNATKMGETLCRSASGANALLKCVKDNANFDQLKTCFSFTEVFQVNKNIQMLKNGAAYWCKNKGDNVQKFLDNKGMDCFNQTTAKFKSECNSSLVMYYAHTTKDKAFCNDQGKSMDCIVNTVNETSACNNLTKTIITAFIDTVRKDSPCSAATTFQLSAISILVGLLLHLKDYAAPKSE